MKKWRRTGRRDAGPVALTIVFFAPDIWSGAPSQAFLAYPGSAAEWYYRVNGGAWTLFDSTGWPFANNILTLATTGITTMQWFTRVLPAFDVTSNILTAPF
jgi:hypothetical protein